MLTHVTNREIELVDMLLRNGDLSLALDSTAMFTATAAMGVPDWYIAGGAVVQTIWNVLTGQPPGAGIRDYDLLYFGPDQSWAAEDAVIRAGRDLFAEVTVPVQIRNQARVHVWFEEKFGTPCPAYTSTEDAIDHFAATTCCVGVRLEGQLGDPDARWRIYAPHGLDDAFAMVVRPNPRLDVRGVYEEKTQRWQQQWPALTVVTWPEG